MNTKIWRKRWLIPLWVVELTIIAIYIVISAIGLFAVRQVRHYYDDSNDSDLRSATRAVNAGAAVGLAFGLYTLLSIIAEIILATRHILSPLVSTILQTLKTTIWTVFLVVDLAGSAASGGIASVIGYVIEAILLLACVIHLAYSGRIYHRDRKVTLRRGEYTPAQPTTGVDNVSTSYTGPAANPFSDPLRDPSPYSARSPAHELYGGEQSNPHGYYEPSSFEMHGAGQRGTAE